MWTILHHLLVKERISVGYIMSCEWQHSGGWSVKECSFAAVFQHWHWPLRGKSLCVLLMKSHLVWRKVLSVTYYGCDCFEYLWRILNILTEIICSFPVFSHRFVLRQVHGLFQNEFSTEWDLVLFFLIPISPLFSRSSNSFLRLLTRLLVPSIFTSMLCRGMQFLPNMWPIQLAFLAFIVH